MATKKKAAKKAAKKAVKKAAPKKKKAAKKSFRFREDFLICAHAEGRTLNAERTISLTLTPHASYRQSAETRYQPAFYTER
jgi:hypothetical protein